MIFRLKLNDTLAREMVAKLPGQLFLSDSTTFLDPAMAGGQYVAAVESRLRKAGHSDKNISGRVFGVEKSLLRVNFAVNKNKLVGSYSVDKKDVPSILIESMKFDAIVGNPPYQNGPKGSSGKLWMLFVEESIKSLKGGGYLCIVHPIGWRTINNWMWTDIYQKNQVEYVKIEPDVDWSAGVKVDWYILRNLPCSKMTLVDFGTGVKSIDFTKVNGIITDSTSEKILNFKSGRKFVFEQSCEAHTQYKDFSEEKVGKYKYPVRHTSPKNVFWVPNEHSWQNKKKVLVSRSGYLTPEYDGGKTGTTQDCFAIFVSSREIGTKIVRLLNSKLYVYLLKSLKTSGFNDKKILNEFPDVTENLKNSFVDTDLYTHFKLTNEEIKKIEDTIKD